MTNPPNVRATAAQSQCALPGQAPADLPAGRRPTLTAAPDPGAADQQALTCQIALAHGDPHTDAPDAGDFLRQEQDALRRGQTDKANVYWLCARRAFRAQQAETRALTIAPLEHGPDLPPAA